MESISLDDLDRRIIQALQLDPRAPFSRLAKALGSSEQTIARRYRQLRDENVVRVVGQLDSQRLGQSDWIARLRCVPGASVPIAEALARRPDTAWVQLTSGGTEVFCTIRSHDRSERTALLLDKLPASRQIVSVEAYWLLHLFTVGWAGWGEGSRLTDDEIAQLLPPVSAGSGSPPTSNHVEHLDGGLQGGLQGEDRPLVRALAADGRATYRELAARTHWHESTVRRRMDDLIQSGALYFDVDVSMQALGVEARAILWLAVEPSHLTAAGEALGRSAEIPFVAATTGATNLVASLACRDHRALFDFLRREIAALDGVTRIETSPIVRAVKMHAAVSPSES